MNKLLLAGLVGLSLSTLSVDAEPFSLELSLATQAVTTKVNHAEANVKTTMQSVDINKDTAEQLSLLKGVGEKKAQAIVDYRNKYGSFSSIDDLTAVPGIGPVIVEQNRANIRL
ncbi:ComEA family DNA-binding protein [Shewanella gelidii]|uniref:Competence protein ComEA n=1 Tax=Shewanella gelidii TaxID=1642821 RepID=A0A917N9K8_9GAMM|nr:ComEA family DNA-binding protein [Shewanella gelidii]MCL1097459.1 helix-hairpin-helix domain-containing protein [Shewanella gelidii]GGI75349.1 competence protein ComEA [Shewanella gelidii]